MPSHLDVDFGHLEKSLKFGADDAAKKWREQQWKVLDANSNGIVSLSEYETWLRNGLGLEEYFFGNGEDYKETFRLALKACVKESGKHDGYLRKAQFRAMLQYTRIFLEFYAMFDELDEDNDEKIGLVEFKKGVARLNQFGAKISDAEAEFKEMDGNGSGRIFFVEFLEYATKHNLDHDED